MSTKMRMRAVFAIAFLAFAAADRSHAVEPDEVLADPILEQRAREISRELRCVVCQSQSIDDSNAPLAKDMRIVVRERLLAGDSDEEVLRFLTSRYGDYVRLNPPLKGATYFLWAAPLIIFAAAAGLSIAYLKRMKERSDKDGKGRAPTAESGGAEIQ